MAEIARIDLNPTEKEFLVEQFRDMLDQAHTVRTLDSVRCSRMVEIANLDNVSIDAMLSSGTTVPSAFHTKPEWPTDFPVIRRRGFPAEVIRRREILITVDEIVENIKL